MHNRRFGAFLMGGWLLGTLMVWFSVSQGSGTVDRILSAIPPQVQKEFSDMGPDVARQILQFEASESNRRVTGIWEILQLGIAAALLASSVLTSSRSKTMIVFSSLLVIMACIVAFYLTPSMDRLARAYDFLPATAAARDREEFQLLDVWRRVLSVLSTMAALVVTARLLFDFYEFGDKLIPDLREEKRRRRRKPSNRLAPDASAAGTAETQSQTSANI